MIFHDVMYMNKNSRVICFMNPSGIRIVSEIGLKVSLEIIFLLKQRIHQRKKIQFEFERLYSGGGS